MEQNITNVFGAEEALSEYFNLKRDYENKIMNNKKKIMNNYTLSKREKRSEYLKLKPKCINCQKPGGTIFKTTYFPEMNNVDSYRQYTATCGIIANPCNLDIKIQMGKYELLPDTLKRLKNNITELKNKIIDTKNKLLFGYLDTTYVLEQFEELKEAISNTTSLYAFFLDTYVEVTDNDEKNVELSETLSESYSLIEDIKTNIEKMNETDNTSFVREAVSIYVNILEPLLLKIRNLKYSETSVWYNENLNTFNLIQKKYTISDLLFSNFQNKVVSYNIGLDKPKKKTALVIESDETPVSKSKFAVKKPLIIESDETDKIDDTDETDDTDKTNERFL